MTSLPADLISPTPERRSTAQRIIIGAVVAVLGLLMLEGLASVGVLFADIMRLQPPVQNFRQAAYDSLVGWVSLPNLAIRDNFGPGLTLTTNADGIRIHRPISHELPAGERRLVCLGASFTFGSGVADSDTFCARLETTMPGVRTINMAQRGFGIDQSYLYYRRDGARYAHNVQLLAVNAGDLDRTLGTSASGYPKPTLALRNGALVPQNVPVPKWKGWSRWSIAGQLLPTLRVAQLVMRRFDLSEEAQSRRANERLWPMVDSLFSDLVRVTRKNGSIPVMVYLPGLPEFAPSSRDERRAKLAASAQRAGIPFVDLAVDLRAVPPDSLERLFLTPNAVTDKAAGMHPSVAGHRWIAERTAEHLRHVPAVAGALNLSPL